MLKRTILGLLASLFAFPFSAIASTPWPTENCAFDVNGSKFNVPLMSQEVGAHHRLLLCSVYDEIFGRPTDLKELTLNVFKIVLVGRTEAERKTLFENQSEMSTFVVSKKGARGYSVTNTVWLPLPGKDTGKNWPLGRVNVTCEKTGKCAVSSKTCALELPRNPFPKAREELTARSLQKADPQPPDLGDDPLAAKVLAQALSGDAAALKDFQEIPKHFSTDGASSENYETLLTALKDAKNMGCLKIAE